MIWWRGGVVAVLTLAACSDGTATAPNTTAGATVAVAPTPAPATETTAPSAPSTPSTPSAPAPTAAGTTAAATGTTTTTPSTTLPGFAGLARDALQVAEIGRSVDGRPILAVERGTRGGTPVLVIGVIHGDEQAGVAILERLATLPVPPGVDLWLVESMNPDGQVVPQRGNAGGVDLNRNFPDGWGPIGTPGDGQYAGTGPASEPETKAIVALVDLIGPELTLFYHQDLNRLSPSNGFEGELKERYSALTGLPIERITGGTYTGVAATWIRKQTGNPSFIVELGPSLDARAGRHPRRRRRRHRGDGSHRPAERPSVSLGWTSSWTPAERHRARSDGVEPRSPVRIRTMSSIVLVQTLPSPILPVGRRRRWRRRHARRASSSTTISSFTLGTKSILYSVPR